MGIRQTSVSPEIEKLHREATERLQQAELAHKREMIQMIQAHNKQQRRLTFSMVIGIVLSVIAIGLSVNFLRRGH